MAVGFMYRVETVLTGVAGGPYYINGHFSVLGGSAQAAATAWWAFLDVGLGSIPTGGVLTLNNIVPTVDAATGNTVAVDTITGLARTGTGTLADFLPWTTQQLAQWRTGDYRSGREIRGRTYIPCHLETYNTGGQPTSAYTAALQTRINTLIADSNSEFVVYSKKNGEYFGVDAGSGWTQWAVLRSRRP